MLYQGFYVIFEIKGEYIKWHLKNQGYYIKYSDTLKHRDPNFDSDVKEEKHTYSISKDGKTISLSDDGDGNGSGIGSNVAAVMLKDVSVKGDKITARVYYYKDDEGEIILTPVKEWYNCHDDLTCF